jgi:hypothetical protein
MLLIPADVLRPRRPDEHYATEAEAAQAAGLTVALVDHDALVLADHAQRAIARVPADGGEAFYRGWMLRSEQYADLERALADRGVILRTSARQYRRAHELPGWYPALAAVTPESVWTTGVGREEFGLACAKLEHGPAVLRDYAKCMKHYWDAAAFIPDISDAAAAWGVAARFIELREDDFTGGFVLRRFEQLTSTEIRTWWLDGNCALVTPHPDTPLRQPPDDIDLARFAPLVRSLDVPFVTLDLARRADGQWRVTELGDGQVSDRPRTTPPEALIGAITNTRR